MRNYDTWDTIASKISSLGLSILFKIHYPFPILVAIFTMTVIMISLGRDTKSSIDIAIPF